MSRARERLAGLTAGTVVGGVIGGLATISSEAGYRWDKFTNPQIYDALSHHMNWWQPFTTDHAWTVLYLQHEPVSAALTFAIPTVIGALAGLGMASRRK